MAQTKLTKHTFMFAEGIHHLKAGFNIFTVLGNEQAVHTTTKSILRGISNRLNASMNDFRMLMSKESLAIVEEELLPDEEVGKFENLKRLYLELPIEVKEVLENVAIELHEKYVPVESEK